MKKLYARMMKAECPIDPGTMETTVPFLQHNTVEHALKDSGVRQIFFFVDPKDSSIFSITIYDTEEDLNKAMREATSEFRFQSLATLGCTAVDARTFEVVAGQINPDAPEVDFKSIVPPIQQD